MSNATGITPHLTSGSAISGNNANVHAGQAKTDAFGFLTQSLNNTSVNSAATDYAAAAGLQGADGDGTNYITDCLIKFWEKELTAASVPQDTKGGDDSVTIGTSPNSSPSNPSDDEPSSMDDNLPNCERPVAANEHGKIYGDPHFEGGDGDRYDVQGEPGKAYNLLSDQGFQLNGKFARGAHSGTTNVGETGLVVKGENGSQSIVAFNKKGVAIVDKTVLKPGGAPVRLADGGSAMLLKDGTLRVITKEGYVIRQEAKASKKTGNRWLNISVTTGKNGVDHGRMPGGLLGQTFDEDNIAKNGATGKGAQGEGAISGHYSHYEVDSLSSMKNEGPSVGAAAGGA